MSVNELIVLDRRFLLYNVRDYILGVVVSSHSIDNMIEFSLSHMFCARAFSCSISSQLYWSCRLSWWEKKFKYVSVWFGFRYTFFVLLLYSVSPSILSRWFRTFSYTGWKKTLVHFGFPLYLFIALLPN